MVAKKYDKSKKFYSVRQIAEMFNISPPTVYDAINSGRLNAIRFERSIRVSEADLEAFLEPVYKYLPYRDEKRVR